MSKDFQQSINEMFLAKITQYEHCLKNLEKRVYLLIGLTAAGSLTSALSIVMKLLGG